MRDHEQRRFLPAQVIFQPGDGIAVQMIGRLIEQQQITRLHKCCCKSKPLLLPPG